MNIRVSAVLFSTLFVSQMAFSQTKREILEEDPKLSPNLRLELTPLNLTASNGDNNTRSEFTIRASYRANNRVAISGEYMRSMFDMSDEYRVYKHDGKKQGYGYEGGITYFFANKEKEVEEWMPVKSESVGYRTVQVTVDPVPMTRLALYGARVGYGNITNSATNYNTTLINVNNPNQGPEEVSATPMLSTGFAFVGLNATRIKNTKVKYPVYGTRRKQYIREYFLDFIYPTSNTYSTVESEDNGVKIVYQIDPNASTNKLMNYGARFGFFSTPTGRVVNLGYGVEIGSMPRGRTFSEGIYWNIRLTLSLMKNLNTAE